MHIRKMCFILLAVTGCTVDYTVLSNQSSFPVSFSYRSSKYILNPGESTEIKFYDYDQSHLKLHTPKVYLDNVVFRDCQSYPLKVINSLGVTATLSADGWMSSEPETIAVGEDGTLSHGSIYTKTPTFAVAASNGFPAQAAYNFDGTNVLVTLRW